MTHRPDKVAEARAIALLAATLHADARARPVRAIEALAAVVVNRARRAAADAAARLRFTPALAAQAAPPWPALVLAACRAPFLFACWRNGRMVEAGEDPVLAACQRIAARAVAGTLGDPTGGATHWHGADTLPSWAIGEVPLAEIGGLVFYAPAPVAVPTQDGRAPEGPPMFRRQVSGG